MRAYLRPMQFAVENLRDGEGRLRAWMRGRRLFDEAAFPAYCCMGVLFLIVSLSVFAGGYDYDLAFVAGNISAIALFIAFGWGARWLGFAPLAAIAESWMLLLAVSALTAVLAFVAAALALPVVDGALASADRQLFGFERDVLASFPQQWPQAYEWSRLIYNMLSPQPFLLLALLFAIGAVRAGWAFLLAWSFALIGCLIVSPFMPAYGSPPYVLDWIDVFEGARDGSLRMIDASVLTGIITFPSFHAAGAMVLAWGFLAVPYLRVPMIALNAAVAVTAVLVGGHYIVDIVAGFAVAALAIWLAHRAGQKAMIRQAAVPTGG